MFESDVTINRLLLNYSRLLVADLHDEQLAIQPLADVNHPAWILGHLAYSGDMAASLLGGGKTLGDDWATRFGPGSKLSAVRADYPSKDELLRVLDEQFCRACDLAANATHEQVSLPNPHPRLKDSLTTIRDVFAFLLTAHLGLHLGQLSAWRRMTGLAPLF